MQSKSRSIRRYKRQKVGKKIKTIDKNRARHREVISPVKWGNKEAYHLCVNTTNVEPKKIAPIVASYANSYFESINK